MSTGAQGSGLLTFDVGAQPAEYSTEVVVTDSNPNPSQMQFGQKSAASAAFNPGISNGNIAVQLSGNAAGGTTVAVTSDGKVWNYYSIPVNAWWISVAYGNGTFVAVATGVSTYVVARSTDGMSWVSIACTQSTCDSVDFGNGRFVAVGATGPMVSTDNGLTWYNPGSIAGLSSVTFGNGVFISVSSSSSTAYTSTDGEVWAPVTLPITLGVSAVSVNYVGGNFLASSNTGCCLSKDNGATWFISDFIAGYYTPASNGVHLVISTPTSGVMHKYKIVIENDRALFYIDGACQASIDAPTGLGFPTFAQSQPVMVRCVHSSTSPALANTPKVGYIFVGLQDAVGLAKSMAEAGAIAGKMGSQGQSGGTMGSTALFTNSMAAGAGVALTNTTAAAGAGLGGQFAVLPTLAVPTDGILCSYLNPAATSAIPGKTLYIRGVKVQGLVTTVLVGGPVLYAFSLAYGNNALSLAQAEGAGTKAPRRIPLGYETYAATAAVGVVGSQQGVYMQFNAPIAINPGEYVAVAAKNLGTVTTSGVITFQVAYDAYWE